MEKTTINNENELWPEDQELFSRMEGSYTSEEEKNFFETLHRKMLTEYAPCGELLLSPRSNADRIELDRVEYDEFIIGHIRSDEGYDQIHLMKLSEALDTDLHAIGFVEEEGITLLRWLRKQGYADMIYNHNNLYV